MEPNTILALVGIGLTINGAMLAYVVRVEHRLTKIETLVSHALPEKK